MSFTVKMKHKDFGEVVIENVTEIHYCYPSPIGKKIAFESSIDCTGYTYPIEDLIEFEAVEQPLAPDAEAVCVCGDELFAVNPDGKCAWCKLPRR